MKKLLYLGLLSVCVLLGSCVEKNVSNVFDKVERYMDVYPDSALLLLEQIPHPEKLRGKSLLQLVERVNMLVLAPCLHVHES